MIGLIFGDTEFPKEIVKTVKKRKIKYLIIDLSKSKKFKKDRKSTDDDFSINPLYKRYADNNVPLVNAPFLQIDSTVTITKAYEAISHYLGFGYIEAGKTMGLAPYGKSDDNIPKFFLEDLPGRGDKNVLVPNLSLIHI